MSKIKWTVDPAHSEIEFSVRHLMIANVKGLFEKFDAQIEADPEDLTTADIEFNIDVASINTRNEDRDNHLRSDDFFDVEKHPTLTFKATDIVKTGDDTYDITGDVTISGVTRSETFSTTFAGQVKDPVSGMEKAGFNAEGKIKRGDYGLTYNAPLETGGVLIGDDINISIHIEASKEA